MEPPRRHRPLDPNQNRDARVALNAHLAQVRRVLTAAESALMALDRSRVDDAHAGLLTARERLAEAATGLDGAIEEIEKVRRGWIAP
jgi:hypothetical protein